MTVPSENTPLVEGGQGRLAEEIYQEGSFVPLFLSATMMFAMVAGGVVIVSLLLKYLRGGF